jgi:hypothetical protein
VEAKRLHEFHCTGCSEYGNHGGERSARLDKGRRFDTPVHQRNAGFDSPPPPSIHAFGSNEDYEGRHTHTSECYDC